MSYRQADFCGDELATISNRSDRSAIVSNHFNWVAQQMVEPVFKVGDRVRVLQIPPQVLKQMPPESIELFRRCVGQILQIDDLNDLGWLELNVMDDGSQAPNYCHHTIWLEPEFVERV